MKLSKEIWGVLRIALGAIFLWAFLDKLFGLGFSTPADKSWLAGNSPTYGFLTGAVKGPLASFYQGLAGNIFVDWLFMLGLLFVGVGLILGIFVRLSSLAGALMLFLTWTAVLPPKNNPLLDDHIIYLLVMIGFIVVHAGRWIGLGTWWHDLEFVKKHKWLE